MAFDSREVDLDKGRKQTRETLLWDLAGQPGYRLVHQLHLNEVAAALVVFDGRSETDPFAGVRYWDRALRQARRTEGSAMPLTKFLVAARTDRTLWRLPDAAGLIPAPTFYGATLATRHLHPIAEFPADPCTPQMGIPGPWQERLPHFLVDSVPASGDELQTEYFVARRHAVAAMAAVTSLRREMESVLKISEVRSMAADRQCMSMAYGEDTVGIHFSWKKDWAAVQKLLPVIEERLAPYQPRPHWGKLFTMKATEVQARYPKLKEFQALVQSYDPQGKFRNDYLDATIFG